MGYAIGVQHALGQLAASAARYALPAATPDRREALARTYVAEHGGSFTLLDDHLLDLSIEQSAAALAVRVSMDVSGLPDIPILSAVFRFPDLQTASAVIAIQP